MISGSFGFHRSAASLRSRWRDRIEIRLCLRFRIVDPLAAALSSAYEARWMASTSPTEALQWGGEMTTMNLQPCEEFAAYDNTTGLWGAC